MQKTSGADVRSVMDDIVSENRFQALSAPRSSAQPDPGALALPTKPDNQSMLGKLCVNDSLYVPRQSAAAANLPAMWCCQLERIATHHMLDR